MKYVEGYTSGENPPAMNDISTSDLIHFYGNWVWRAVEAIVQAKDFNPNPNWIADRLNISVEAAKDAIEGLGRIGAIRISEEGIVANSDFGRIDGLEIDRADQFSIHNKIKDQINNRITSRDAYCNVVLLSSKEDVAAFYHKFCALVEELNNKSQIEGKSKDVFAMELSFAKLTREQK